MPGRSNARRRAWRRWPHWCATRGRTGSRRAQRGRAERTLRRGAHARTGAPAPGRGAGPVPRQPGVRAVPLSHPARPQSFLDIGVRIANALPATEPACSGPFRTSMEVLAALPSRSALARGQLLVQIISFVKSGTTFWNPETNKKTTIGDRLGRTASHRPHRRRQHGPPALPSLAANRRRAPVCGGRSSGPGVRRGRRRALVRRSSEVAGRSPAASGDRRQSEQPACRHRPRLPRRRVPLLLENRSACSSTK